MARQVHGQVVGILVVLITASLHHVTYCATSSLQCVNMSATLNVTECVSWRAGFDRINGVAATVCGDKRDDPCDCSRVECAENHVAKILWYQVGLSGEIPVEWSVMAQVTEINLYGNDLSGPLPTEWSALVLLERLTLANNRLSGTLPTAWSALTSMQRMSLGGNDRISGTLPAA